ncbi:MAG: hypothetical protein AAF570_26755, partial [Bacteroidota bacterium]
AMYAHLLRLFMGQDPDTYFPRFSAVLDRHGPKMDRIERVNIFGFLINFFTQQDRKGVPGSQKRLFDTYKEMVAQDLVFGLSRFSYRIAFNITTLACKLKAIDWTTDFLPQIREKIPAPDGENLFHYGSAYLEFARENYSAARRKLIFVQFEDPIDRLSFDVLSIRIAYESRDSDLFDAVHARLTRRLYRKAEVSDRIRRPIHNFLRVVQPMFDLQHTSPTPAELDRIKEMLENAETITGREWLEAKFSYLCGINPNKN